MLTVLVMVVCYGGGISSVFLGKTDFSPYLSLVSIYIYIYILHTSKLICITMHL